MSGARRNFTNLSSVKWSQSRNDSGKLVANFAAPTQEIGHSPLVKGGRVPPSQNLRYRLAANLTSGEALPV